MVLAISSLLAVTLFSNYSSQQRRTRFNDAVERTASFLEQTKAEVNATFTGCGSASPCGASDPTRQFFGKVVSFTAGSSDLSAQSLTSANQTGLASIQDIDTPTTFTIPWGVTINGFPTGYDQVAVTRNLTDGSLNLYVLTCPDPTQTSCYGTTEDTATDAQIELISPDGLKALIHINATTNEISRTYEN